MLGVYWRSLDTPLGVSSRCHSEICRWVCRHFAIPDQRREINDGINCDVFQTYRYLIRESEIYFQQVLLYLEFENEYYFSCYDIFGNCLFFYIWIKSCCALSISCILRVIALFQELFQLHRADLEKLYLELLSVLIFKAKIIHFHRGRRKKKNCPRYDIRYIYNIQNYRIHYDSDLTSWKYYPLPHA